MTTFAPYAFSFAPEPAHNRLRVLSLGTRRSVDDAGTDGRARRDLANARLRYTTERKTEPMGETLSAR